jgi:cytochrome c-type biogenesis protein CcmF
MPAALVGVVSRNRRRYGGYIVHIGIAVLLIGVAASSSFQTNEEVTLRPGESTEIDGRTITYVKPTVEVSDEYLQFGGVLRVEEGGEVEATLRPSRRYFRPTGQEAGMISGFFAGEATSEIGLKAGPGSDLWSAMQPDIDPVQKRVRAADKGFRECVRGAPGTPAECDAVAAMMRAAAADPSLGPQALATITELQSLAANRIAQSYIEDGSPAIFKFIVDPLVTWMWIGGLISLAGALIALWPARGRRRGALVRTETDALKEAKYREIRDAELDHASGKLSDEDFALLDAELRREAVEILDRVENGNGPAPAAEDEDAGETREKVPQG